MMITPNEESEWIHHVVCHIDSPVLFIQHDNSDCEAEKKREHIFKMPWTDWNFTQPISRKGFLVLQITVVSEKNGTFIWHFPIK